MRGYLDVGNEHPIEHWVGVLSTWGAVLAAVQGPTGVHDVTLFLFFNIHAALAMLNHYDAVQLSINPPYSELQQSMQTASMGIHTMQQEHFGIGII
jgi:hypothetical protein